MMLNTTHHFSQVGNKVAHLHKVSTEFAANLFRSTQTEEKLKRDQVSNKRKAIQTHFKVGEKVRATIEELGGMIPEDLPTPEKGIPQLVRTQKKLGAVNE